MQAAAARTGQDYERELEAIGWVKILDPERIWNDSPRFIESRTTIRRARDLIDKYRARNETRLSQIRREVEISGMKPRAQRNFLAGFEKGLSRSKLTETYSLEEQILSEIENIFALLAARPNSWQLEGGRILFSNKPDLDLLNSYLTRINQLAMQQQEIRDANTRFVQELSKNLSK